MTLKECIEIAVNFQWGAIKDDITLNRILLHCQQQIPGPYILKWKDVDNSDEIEIIILDCSIEEKMQWMLMVS